MQRKEKEMRWDMRLSPNQGPIQLIAYAGLHLASIGCTSLSETMMPKDTATTSVNDAYPITSWFEPYTSTFAPTETASIHGCRVPHCLIVNVAPYRMRSSK